MRPGLVRGSLRPGLGWWWPGASRARGPSTRSAGCAPSVKLVRRAWIVCIGYQRFRYELEHPRAPNEVMPLEEAIDIANGCLNPYAFLVEDE